MACPPNPCTLLIGLPIFKFSKSDELAFSTIAFREDSGLIDVKLFEILSKLNECLIYWIIVSLLLLISLAKNVYDSLKTESFMISGKSSYTGSLGRSC